MSIATSPDEPLAVTLAGLAPRHRDNLAHILQLSDEQWLAARRDGDALSTSADDSPDDTGILVEAIRWRYHSRTRERVLDTGKALLDRVKVLSGAGADAGAGAGAGAVSPSRPPPAPTYRQLVSGLAESLDVFEPELDLELVEKYVIYTVMAECLQRMSPAQRVRFFEESIDVSAVLGDGIVPSGLRGPLTTLSALGLANGAGQGIYLAAATVLGMMTHALGISLPAAVTAGLTSTAAFVIGPAGWLAAGGWLAWRMTGPDWKVLAPVVMYLMTTKYDPDVLPSAP